MGKKLLLLGLVFVLVGVWTPNVFAFGYVGRPTAELSKGQWSAGFNYSYSSQDLDTTKATGAWFASLYDEAGVLRDEGSGTMDPVKWESRDFNTQRYVGRLAYGISDGWTVYGQLGGADVKGEWREVGNPDVTWGSINFDNDFTWGLGTKITFAKQPKTEWGVAVQMNWLDTSRSKKGSGSGVDEDGEDGGDPYTYCESETWDLDTWDLLIAVGPTVDMGGWRLYGGPFYYYISGDLDMKYTQTDTYEDGWIYRETETAGGDVEADSNFGGYIGAQVDISKTCNATLEFAATGDGWGMGAGLTFLCK